MNAAALIARCQSAGIALLPVGDKLKVRPVPPPDLLNELRSHKSELLALLSARKTSRPTMTAVPMDALVHDLGDDDLMSDARASAIRMLEDKPTSNYALRTLDVDCDPVRIALAVRGKGSLELLIPKDRYDPFAIISMLQQDFGGAVLQ